MKLKTYHAYTMAEALGAVKSDLGHDAVILNTRTFKRGGFLGLGRRNIVEVTATPAEERAAPRVVPKRRVDPARVAAGRAYAAAAPVAGRVSAAAPAPKPAPAVKPGPAATLPATPVSVPPPISVPPAAAAADPPTRETRRTPPPDVDVSVEPVARRYILQPAAGAVKPPQVTETKPEASPARPRPTTPERGWPELDAMQQELGAIRHLVGKVLQRGDAAPPMPDLPPPLFDLHMRLLGQDLDQHLADAIAEAVAGEMNGELRDRPDEVRRLMERRLAQKIPVAEEAVASESPDGRPLVVALIGPTGVGKTTTLAKLAATFKLRRGKHVGLVTADTYRIAAVDQLRTYANIIGLPLKVAMTPADMRQAIHALSDCDVILVDTAGRGQRDSSRLDELRRFIAAAEPHEVHLVLSATAGEKVLHQEADAFAPIGAHKIALTKIDEAVSLGPAINVVRRAGLPLSFITNGQEVPDHIERAEAERLAALLLGEAVVA